MPSIKQALVTLALLAGMLPLASPAAAEDEFPGRKLYPDVATLSLEQLHARLDEVNTVDVRSAFEYKTLHISGASNIPLADPEFAAKLAELRAGNDKDIVVYCNGKTCMKSYKAAQKAAAAGIDRVYAYDAGIMDWAKAYPKQALLLGKPLGDAKRLISKAEFKKHLLSPGDFGERIAASNALVLDVRDRLQRDSLGIFPGRERRVYLDDSKKLDRYIRKALQGNRGLLIYDAAGKQVRWLQYYLKDRGVRNYAFMKGGARAYYKEMTDDFLGGK